MHLSQAANAIHASLYGDDVLFTSVSKDSRNIHRGDIYIAIKGERFDGHKFIDQAEKSGAVAALVSEKQRSELPQLCVSDTRLALGQLAAYWTQQWHQMDAHMLVGITGSNGKTTVKEMCRSIFSQAIGSEDILCTRGNLNNDIGMPLTLLGLRDNHRYAVIEMGANHSGEINYLSDIAKPDIAVITNVGSAHLEGFGSEEKIAAAKAEIFNGLSSRGIAIINSDDRFAGKWLQQISVHSHLAFSMKNKKADIYAWPMKNGKYGITTPQGEIVIQLSVPGKHNVMNALAATAVACAVGINLQAITEGLQTFENISGRLKYTVLKNGSVIIDDSYNANPLSVRAAIDVLVEQCGHAGSQLTKCILVLGDMAELGGDAARLHAETGKYARTTGVDVVYTSGQYGKNTVDAFGQAGVFFATQEDVINHLLTTLQGGEVILIKGSRSAHMDKVVSALLDQYPVRRMH